MANTLLIAPQRGPLAKPIVFLAGGITNSPRWQDEAVGYLEQHVSSVTICNPRRERDFEDDAIEYQTQVTWELDHLQSADLVMFWFPAAECRITRIELGFVLGREQAAIIGADPAFVNRRYFEALTRRLGLPLHAGLENLFAATAQWLANSHAAATREP